MTDAGVMARALDLARGGLGRVAPNPSVGCVIVRDGVVVGEGRTADGGRPHAEVVALGQAGEGARGATAYVTLEPCSHYGKTPPCAEALIAAGIARVVVATTDPDPRVDGRGIAMLRAAGIPVEVGLLGAEAEALNEGFFSRVRRGRPFTTLKIASTIDGKIATRTGESRWITGEEARAEVHRMRAMSDAVMVGAGTALADDPMLTVRLPGHDGRQPVRVVLDARLDLPATLALFRTARNVPTWVVTLGGSPDARRRLEDASCAVVDVTPDADGRLPMAGVLRALGDRGITRLLIESGARLSGALIAADVVDRLEWFRAPILIGGDGVPAIGPLGVTALAEARHWVRTGMRTFGRDSLETYEPRH